MWTASDFALPPWSFWLIWPLLTCALALLVWAGLRLAGWLTPWGDDGYGDER